MRFFNTLTRTVESFKPLNPEEVRIYCCGPTVYNYQHIGNLRTYIFEDTLVRALRYKGYKVRHVMNVTDVGHLVSDADEGEDKMLVAAKREGKRSEDIATFYTEIFLEHCGWLNIIRPDIICKATDHIAEMIEMIRTLESKGYAYITGGNVYFDVSKFPKYGELARLNVEELQAGARIEVDENKRSPYDFVLWFTKSKFENQELQWNSPWGRGYPGWHIECSAMARRYLGDEFDIHCGGIDHIPVHHTNEIAQSCGATGCAPARFWMHGNFLVVGSDKMSKSTGEFLTLDLLKERGFDPLAYRLFCFSSSYRSELTWSWEGLEGAANSLRRIRNQIELIREKAPAMVQTLTGKALEDKQEFDEAISDDLSLPRAIAVLHKILGTSELEPGEKLSLIDHFDQVLGLSLLTERVEEIPDNVNELASRRAQARKNRDFAEADRLRDELLALGFVVEDTKEGWKVKKA